MSQIKIASLAFEKLSFSFDVETPVFEGVTFKMPETPAVWVTAPRERGRSTFLRLLAGLDSADSGHYWMSGQDVNKMSFEDFLPYRLAIGYGFDLGGMINNKSLRDNLLLPLNYHQHLPTGEAEARVDGALARFGLAHVAEMRPFSLGGSQRKLACVIRAFLHWPQIVLLDDPLTGVKHQYALELLRFIEEGYSERGLAQVFFTGEARFLADAVTATELQISRRHFSARRVGWL